MGGVYRFEDGQVHVRCTDGRYIDFCAPCSVALDDNLPDWIRYSPKDDVLVRIDITPELAKSICQAFENDD